jgi:hypothetical protein
VSPCGQEITEFAGQPDHIRSLHELVAGIAGISPILQRLTGFAPNAVSHAAEATIDCALTLRQRKRMATLAGSGDKPALPDHIEQSPGQSPCPEALEVPGTLDIPCRGLRKLTAPMDEYLPKLHVSENDRIRDAGDSAVIDRKLGLNAVVAAVWCRRPLTKCRMLHDLLTAPPSDLVVKGASGHAVGEDSSELSGFNPDLEALSGFEECPGGLLVGCDPDHGGVGHRVVDDPRADNFTMFLNFDRGADEPRPFVMAVSGHLSFSSGCSGPCGYGT